MSVRSSLSLLSRQSLFALVLVFCFLLLTTTSALADTVRISDQAHALNATKITDDASGLGYPIDIYTTNTFKGSNALFVKKSLGHITSPQLLVIAIDTKDKFLTILGGKNILLTQDQYTKAGEAFSNAFKGDYTVATLAAIDSLKNSSGASSFNGVLVGVVVVVVLLIVAAGVAFSIIRRRRQPQVKPLFLDDEDEPMLRSQETWQPQPAEAPTLVNVGAKLSPALPESGSTQRVASEDEDMEHTRMFDMSEIEKMMPDEE